MILELYSNLLLGYPIMANKPSEWNASNKLLFSLYRKLSEGEHYKVCQVIGGQIAQVRVFCAVFRFFFSAAQLNIPQEWNKTKRHKQNSSLQGISSHLCCPLTRALSPQYITSPTTSCTHTLFLMLLSPRAPSSHFTLSLTCAICLSLPTFSHIFYTSLFFIAPFPPSPWSV